MLYSALKDKKKDISTFYVNWNGNSAKFFIVIIVARENIIK